MEPSPLPPHERNWRHPSELAAEERVLLRAEAAAPSMRVFALTTGTLGLIAVGILILTVTPQRHDSPIALRASTTQVAGSADGGTIGRLRSQAVAGLAGIPSTRPTEVATVATSTRRDAAVALLATPIGDGHVALVTAVALAATDATSILVRFSSGATGTAEVVAVGDAVGLVALATAEPGHPIAAALPDPTDLVTVQADPPITVAFGDIDEVDVDEGTAVLDDGGALVGLCTDADGATRLVDVTTELAGATTSVP